MNGIYKRVVFLMAACGAVSAQAQSSGATLDSLASDLAALTARAAKLEGEIATADLAGTYALHGIQVELGGGNPARVSSYVLLGTAVLSADGTGSFTSGSESGNTLTLGPNPSVGPFMGSGGGGSAPF